MDTYSAEAAAAIIGNVSASTVRNWCKIYAPVLDAAANPPVGTERRLTQADVATLQQVRAMRDAKRSVEDILATLQQVTTKLQPTPLTIEGVTTAPTTAQEARSDDYLLPVALSSMASRQDATDKRVDALQQAIAALEHRQAARADSLVTGVIIGGAVVLIVVALVLALPG